MPKLSGDRLGLVRELVAAGLGTVEIASRVGIQRRTLARWLYKQGDAELGALFARVTTGERRCRGCGNYSPDTSHHCLRCLPKAIKRFTAVKVIRDGAGNLVLLTWVAPGHFRVLPLPSWAAPRACLYPRRPYHPRRR